MDGDFGIRKQSGRACSMAEVRRLCDDLLTAEIRSRGWEKYVESAHVVDRTGDSTTRLNDDGKYEIEIAMNGCDFPWIAGARIPDEDATMYIVQVGHELEHVRQSLMARGIIPPENEDDKLLMIDKWTSVIYPGCHSMMYLDSPLEVGAETCGVRFALDHMSYICAKLPSDFDLGQGLILYANDRVSKNKYYLPPGNVFADPGALAARLGDRVAEAYYGSWEELTEERYGKGTDVPKRILNSFDDLVYLFERKGRLEKMAGDTRRTVLVDDALAFRSLGLADSRHWHVYCNTPVPRDRMDLTVLKSDRKRSAGRFAGDVAKVFGRDLMREATLSGSEKGKDGDEYGA